MAAELIRCNPIFNAETKYNISKAKPNQKEHAGKTSRSPVSDWDILHSNCLLLLPSCTTTHCGTATIT